ncbi:MAG: hypothetical protein M1409_01135 [Actinobacteria bacterium]|nr:hypothetical protein [Actinomycetota bacterium]
MGILNTLTSLHWLVPAHAATGEIGALAFLWVIIELANRREKGYVRAKWASLGGFILLFTSWFLAGTYYLTHYGNVVKKVILGGNLAWAHNIIMETKEHVFIFIPILALLAFLLILSFPILNGARKVKYQEDPFMQYVY